MADGTQSARESHRTLRGGNIRFTDRVRERRNALSRPSCGTPERVWRPSSSRVVPAAHNAAIVDGELAAIHFWRAFRSAPGNRKHSLPERNESGGASTWEPHHNQLADSCIYGSPRHFECPAIRPCARVESVAFAPLVSTGSNGLSVEGTRGEYQGALGNDVSEAAVDVDYFRVMEIPFLKGREFEARVQQKTLPVAIVNEALASKYLHGDPVGQHIRLGKLEDKHPWLTVVVGVGNVKEFAVCKELGYVTDPCVYLPLTQSPDSKVAILARSAREPSAVIPAIRDKFSHLDGSLPPLDLTTMHEWLSQFFNQPRFRA